jgi:hypothetical protein
VHQSVTAITILNFAVLLPAFAGLPARRKLSKFARPLLAGVILAEGAVRSIAGARSRGRAAQWENRGGS